MRFDLTAIQVKAIADMLREKLSYDPETGEFRYMKITSQSRVNIGDIAGGFDRAGYRIINIFGRRLKAHRLAWLYVHGEWPKGEVDHINGQKADNRITNLRDTDRAGNQQNVHRPRRDNKLGIRGVRKLGGRSKRYIVQMWQGGERITIGHYDTPEEGGAAYRAAKAAYLAENSHAV